MTMPPIIHPLWFLDDPIDIEHKQYILMSYIKYTNEEYRHLRLNPHLRQLLSTSTFMEAFKKKRTESFEAFKTFMGKQEHTLNDIQLKEIHTDSNNSLFSSVTKILDWSLPIIKKTITEGSLIWEAVSDSLTIQYIGKLPVSKDSGYIVFHITGELTAEIFSFDLSPVVIDDTKYRGFILINKGSIPVTNPEGNTMDLWELKKVLVKNFKLKSDILCVGVQTDLDIPKEESLHPVMKHEVHKKLQKDFVRLR